MTRRDDLATSTPGGALRAPVGASERRFWAFLGWLALCACAAATGAFAHPDSWFEALRKPVFNPPNAVFGVVWSILYVMMAWSAWRVAALERTARTRAALATFVIQLAFNAVWAPLFFALHSIEGALVDLILLWVALAATIFQFHRLDRKAAWLLAPYFLWVSFAGVLNASFAVLNP